MFEKNRVLNNKNKFRNEIINGILCAKDILKSTFGPHGGTVVKENSYGDFYQSKDGKYSIENLKLESPEENFGIEIIKSVCDEMDNNVGDNTTTAGIFASCIIEALHNLLLRTEKNILEIKSGLSWALESTLKKLETCKIPISLEKIIEQIATISANNDKKIGKLISEIHTKVPNPSVTVELSRTSETSYNAVPGLTIDSGYSFIAPAIGEDARIYALDNAYVLISDTKINHIQELTHIIEIVAQEAKSLVIFAPDFDTHVINILYLNKFRGNFKSSLIKVPGMGDEQTEMLKDIATLVGGDLISLKTNKSLSSVTIANLGKASLVSSSARKTEITNNNADKISIQNRVNYILQEAAEATSEYARKKLETRALKLKNGTAVIHVGGIIESIAKAKKDLVEDAVKAVAAGLESGVIAGGGTTYLVLALHLEELLKEKTDCSIDFRDGVYAVIRSLGKITAMLMHQTFGNADESYAALNDIKRAIKAGNINAGYNLYSREYHDDLAQAGIFDTLKAAKWVLKLGIENAAERFLNAETMILNIPEKNDKSMNHML